MASIYNIEGWSENYSDTYGNYKEWDIVKYGNNFWYCINPHESSAQNFPYIGSVNWDGMRDIPSGGLLKRGSYLFWVPSYSFNVTHQPRVISVQLGDGYEQRMPDGINHDRINFSLNFEKRTLKEATSILHFLSSKQGYKSFYFKAPEPYNIIKKFICPEWSSAMIFEDNHTVTASLVEKAN